MFTVQVGAVTNAHFKAAKFDQSIQNYLDETLLYRSPLEMCDLSVKSHHSFIENQFNSKEFVDQFDFRNSLIQSEK